MPRRFYLDTLVWRDYFEDRGNGVRPLGEFAFRFLRNCLEGKDLVIVSNEVVRELLVYYSIERVNEVFSAFEDIIVKVNYTEIQTKEAYMLMEKFNRKFPLADILHSIIARDENAILVTRDKHFEEIGIVEFYSPEELL